MFVLLASSKNEDKCGHLISKDGFGHGQKDAVSFKHLHLPPSTFHCLSPFQGNGERQNAVY
jgi:hypothetical protein